MATEKKRSSYSPQYKSEWNMTQLDLERMDTILKGIDENYTKCSMGKVKYLKRYLYSLKALYRYIRPLLKKEKSEEIDGEFNRIRDFIDEDDETPEDIFDIIEELHDRIMILRQAVNLGLVVYIDKKYGEKFLRSEFK